VQQRSVANELPEIGTPGRIDLVVEHVGERGAEDAQPDTGLLRALVPSVRLPPVPSRSAASRIASTPIDPVFALIEISLRITVIACIGDVSASIHGENVMSHQEIVSIPRQSRGL
jgi:hypothetical protein